MSTSTRGRTSRNSSLSPSTPGLSRRRTSPDFQQARLHLQRRDQADSQVMHLHPPPYQHLSQEKVVAGSNPFSFISSSMASSLSPSLKNVLSPKLPQPGSSGSTSSTTSAMIKRRIRSNSFKQLRVPRLSIWLRWTIAGLVFVMMLFQVIVRNSESSDRSLVLAAGRKRWSWAVSRLRPKRVAIYCGPETDYDNINSLIYSLSLPSLKERVTPSLYAEHTSDLQKITAGQRDNVRLFAQLYSKPLSLLRTGQQKQDMILIPPSRTPLDALPLLRNQPKASAVFIVKDPAEFLSAASEHPGLPYLQEYFDENRIGFLLLETRHRSPFLRQLRELLSDEDHPHPLLIEPEKKVWSYTPFMDIARVPVKKMKGGRRAFFYYTLFYNDASESTVKYINGLIMELGLWIKRDHANLGYTIIQDSSGKRSLKRTKYKKNEQGIIEKVNSIGLHILLPYYLEREAKEEMISKLRIPPSIRPAIHLHTDDDANALYGKLAKTHLLLPSYPYEFPAHNASAMLPHDPIVPIAIASRLRVLIPHSLEPSYSHFLTLPALIAYPDEPDAADKKDRLMPIFEAVKMVKDELIPRRNMANNTRPWTRIDNEPFWLDMQKKIEDQNVETFVELLGL